MERRRLSEVEHAIIHRWPRQLHEVIEQRIPAAPIRMQETTRQIEASGRGRLTWMPY
jgi:hypothetical protein